MIVRIPSTNKTPMQSLTNNLSLNTYHLLLATYHSLLATYHLLLATYHLTANFCESISKSTFKSSTQSVLLNIFSIIFEGMNMTPLRNITFCCISLMVLIACNRIEDKASKLKDKAKSKGQEIIDTAYNKLFPPTLPDSFSIRSIVKDFKGDKNIKEIKGISKDVYFMYVAYCVYTGKKQRVLNGVNKIVPIKTNDYKSDNKCYEVSWTTFDHDIAPEEKTKQSLFFWNFESLKKYEIYTCVKAPLRHYIIFDKYSDTVYHRIEELRD